MVQHSKGLKSPCASLDDENWVSVSGISQGHDQIDTLMADQTEVNMEANSAMDDAGFKAIIADIPKFEDSKEHGVQFAEGDAEMTASEMSPGPCEWATHIETIAPEGNNDVMSDTESALADKRTESCEASSVLRQSIEPQGSEASNSYMAVIDAIAPPGNIDFEVAAPEANARDGLEYDAHTEHMDRLIAPSSKAFSGQCPFEEASSPEPEVKTPDQVSDKKVAAAELYGKVQHGPEQAQTGASVATNETSIIHSDFDLFVAQKLTEAIADEELIDPPRVHTDAPHVFHGATAYDVASEPLLGDINQDYDADSAFTYPCFVNDGRKRDLSLEQLTILVIATSPNRSLTLIEICHKISSICEYYHKQTLENNISREGGGYPWIRNVEDILHRYDFPTVPSVCLDNGELHFSLPNGGEWWVLNKPSKGKGRPFKFMNLDFDLRLMIYTWTLHHPLPPRWGWIVDPEYTLKSKELYNRHDRQPQRLTTNGLGDWELRTRPLNEVLALTMVNKEVQKEALPVFYRKNCFYFAAPKILGHFYSGIPGRAQWMRSIVLKFDPPTIGHECRRSIAQLFNTGLRNLHIIVDEKRLLIEHVVATIDNVPGVKFLGELSGLDRVTFQGEYHHLKKYLSSKDVTTVKGRKSKDYDTDEGIEKAIKRAREQNNKQFWKEYRNNLRSIKRAENQQKKDKHRLEVSRRQQEREEWKEARLQSIEDERERKHADKERTRRIKEREKEELKEEKAGLRRREKAARIRRLKAAEEAKATRREAREQARLEKARKMSSGIKKKKVDTEKRRIRELEKSVNARLGQQRSNRGRRPKDSDDDETDTEHEHSTVNSPSSDTENDSEISTESDEDAAPPPPSKRARDFHDASFKGGTSASKREAGGSGAAKRAKVSPAEKMAAVRRTINGGKARDSQYRCSDHKAPTTNVKKATASWARADDRVSSDPDF